MAKFTSMVRGIYRNFVRTKINIFRQWQERSFTTISASHPQPAKGLTEKHSVKYFHRYKSFKSRLQTKFTKSHTPRGPVQRDHSSRSQSLQWRRRIEEQRQVCNCCARFGHAAKTILMFLDHGKPKSTNTDNSVEMWKVCEHLQWNQSSSTPHRLETSGVAERAARTLKHGTSSFLLHWWAVAGRIHGMFLLLS